METKPDAPGVFNDGRVPEMSDHHAVMLPNGSYYVIKSRFIVAPKIVTKELNQGILSRASCPVILRCEYLSDKFLTDLVSQFGKDAVLKQCDK